MGDLGTFNHRVASDLPRNAVFGVVWSFLSSIHMPPFPSCFDMSLLYMLDYAHDAKATHRSRFLVFFVFWFGRRVRYGME